LITQSLDIRQMLPLVADKTMKLMGVDAILVFLLNEEAFTGIQQGSFRGICSRGKMGESIRG
ncbi:hypothetical protein ACFLU8_03320, partial [Chloroflexota bacterium]